MATDSDKFIAITGMACRFAGSPDLRAYWLNLLAARRFFSDSENRSDERLTLEDTSSFRHVPTLRAARLGDLWRCTQQTRASISGIDPEWFLAADLAVAALKDAETAGGAGRAKGRMGVFIGHSPACEPSAAAWFQHGIALDQAIDLARRLVPSGAADDFDALKSSLEASLPRFDSRNATSLFPHALAAAVAARCDASGPAACLDGGGTSSAIAIQAACDALLAGRIDLAIVGAVQGVVSPQLAMPYARLGLLSKSGETSPYCADSDGILPGEGGGFMILKRREDAVQGGDRIYALIDDISTASAGNSHKPDGGFAEALRAVWPSKSAFAGTIDLFEGNGCGVPALDRAEIRTFCSAVDGAGLRPGSIALGSVKALCGDCLAASGMAGAIKAALALYHRVIPPGLPEDIADGTIPLEDTPFYIAGRPRPWIHNDAGIARRAGVASMSVGGAASFMLMEQSNR